MEDNGRIKIKPRNTPSPIPAPAPAPPPVETPVERPPLFRIKAKKSNYDVLLAQLTESQRRIRRLKKMLIIGFPILIVVALAIALFLPPANNANLIENIQSGGKSSSLLKFLNEYALIEKGVISDNQSLQSFLEKFRLPSEKIKEINVFAKREGILQLKAGQEYLLFRNKQNDRGIDYFIYEMDAYRYGVFQIYPQVGFQIVEKEVEEKIQRVSGIIKTNLFDAVLSQGIHYDILQKMENALAWSVDFYHLKPGDKFKVIYEEKLADNKTIEIGKMKAIYFSANDREYYAFLFDENGQPAYFSDQGRPMKATFLKSPLRYGRITSHYNLDRLHPVDKVVKPHYGTDYAAEEGADIQAVADGVVEAASFTAGNGNFVKIKHDNTYQTQYLHMQKFAPGIEPGKRIKQGDIIGYVGQTGKATGPHVCFRFWKNGKEVDHTKEDVVVPVRFTQETLQHFIDHRDSLMEQLNTIQF